MKKIIFTLITACMCILVSCKKSGIGEKPGTPLVKDELKTAAGVPTANATTYSVNAANGATIKTPDGRMNIVIPPGALTKNETITIQPITNTSGISSSVAYRVLPHLAFTKPVTITFDYAEADVHRTTPALLRIAFQDSTGLWKYMSKTGINEGAKKLSVTTQHFSDWTIVPLAHIEPVEARIGENESIDLRVLYSFDPDDLFVPLPSENGILSKPLPVSDKFIRKWIAPAAGTLTPDGARATYKAPAKAPAQNPVAISADINFGQSSTYHLVSNITILSEFHIDYLQVNETEVDLPSLQRGSQLYIYGNFGADPGKPNRSVKIGNIELTVTTWSPKLIICEILSEGPTSSGEVTVSAGGKTSSKLLNEWIVNLFYAKKESPDGSLTRKIEFILRFRGDAIGFGSGDTEPVLEYTDLNKSSKALIEMPGGAFSNDVSNDACGTFHVRWAPIAGHVTERSLYSTGKGLNGRVYTTATGFGVKLMFRTADILKTTRSFSPCIGSGYSNIVNEPITLAGFHEETFWFDFDTQAARSPIKAGTPIILTGTGVAPGLYWDVEDLNIQLFTTKLWWEQSTPKYN